MLVDEGKVRWDDPVTNYLPGFQLRDPYITREITVRDLLTHRAGLPNADYLWYGSANSTAEILRRVKFVNPAYSLRSSFIYQNVMYAAAGQVIAAVSGQPWEQFVRTRIFVPLHMDRTVPLLSQAASAPNVAAPHDRIDDTLRVIGNASVDPVAAAITSIDFDHEQYLGHTLAAIAAEKAGVIRRAIPVVVQASLPKNGAKTPSLDMTF